MTITKKVWVIVDKKRKVIAKGVPRSRYLALIDEEDTQQRYLTYSTKGKAESAFKVSGFYCQNQKLYDYLEKEYNYGYKIGDNYSRVEFRDFLEAVEASLILEIKE